MRVHPLLPGVRITDEIVIGDRVGRWLVTGISPSRGRRFLRVLCECGVEREVYRGQLQSGGSMSCGCYAAESSRVRLQGKPVQPENWRFPEAGKEKLSETLRKKWTSKEIELTPAMRQHLEQMGKEHAGAPESGRNAKGPEHHLSKWFCLRSPAGVVIEGWNLREIVRANEDLFSAQDVAWSKNKFGTATHCRAVLGLSKLFMDGENRRGSWKGWTPIAKCDHTKGENVG